MKLDAKNLTIDEAKKMKGKLGIQDEEFEKMVGDKQDEQFKYLRILHFEWKEQEKKDKFGKKEIKFLSRLPNGKICFLDWSDKPEEYEENIPYICAVYERNTDAFAKIICKAYVPRIVILPTRMVSMIWRNDKGETRTKMVGPFDTFEDRILDAIKRFMREGFEEVRLDFKENQR